MTITFTNKITGERTKIEKLNNIGEAWNLASEVCEEMDWNEDMFAEDVIVKELK